MLKSIDKNAKKAYDFLHKKFSCGIIKYKFRKNKEAIIAKSALYSYMYAISVTEGRFLKGEKAIATDAYYAYRYAKDVIRGRFTKAEKIMATDAEYAYWYAKDVIKCRWFEAEKAIAKDAKSAYLYAKYVIKDRWPEAEAVIATIDDPNFCFDYWSNFIKKEWLLGEKNIIKSVNNGVRYACYIGKRIKKIEKNILKDGKAVVVYQYAKDAIKGRWPEAEKIIATDARWAYHYAENVIKGRFAEAEIFIATDAYNAFVYAKNVIKGRWPEGEEVIFSDECYKKLYTEEFTTREFNSFWNWKRVQ